jgi:hypothetical protein
MSTEVSDTEPPPPPERTSDREALVSIAMEAIVGEDTTATNIIDMLRDMGRGDILEEAEELLESDDEEDELQNTIIDGTPPDGEPH